MDAQVVALLKQHGLETTRNIIISVLILMNAADGRIRAAEATAHQKRLLFIMVVLRVLRENKSSPTETNVGISTKEGHAASGKDDSQAPTKRGHSAASYTKHERIGA